jgi:ABC-type antimicrobial peptide transport system permease subunit
MKRTLLVVIGIIIGLLAMFTTCSASGELNPVNSTRLEFATCRSGHFTKYACLLCSREKANKQPFEGSEPRRVHSGPDHKGIIEN